MKVFLDSVGCRLNQAEIEKMALDFRAAGHEIVEDAAQAELVVVNTCAVTAAAASDSRAKIRQANREGVTNIVVTGCWATLAPSEAAKFPGVSQIIANAEKDQLAESVLRTPIPAYEVEPLERKPLPGIHKRTRAFIKVQDGCDNHCTFCVTRIARGASVSLSKEKILKEVLSAEKGDAKEIVLTGVHLGSWGHDQPEEEHLADLIAFLLRETDVPRIRLSSLEPWDLDEHFFTLWQNPRLCRHFHLPLQSGSAAVLKRMARHTTPELFRGLVGLIREQIPQAAITTDLIVGFPGENEAEFRESLAFVEEMQFAGGHVFKYSAREGTPAQRLPGKVNGMVARERSQRMRSAIAKSENEFKKACLNSTDEVLWESVSAMSARGWRLHGLTDTYLPVSAWSATNLWNTISRVKLVEINEDSLNGEILD